MFNFKSRIHPKILLLVLLFGYISPLFATGFQWIIGEELVYKVKWGIIRLGTLKLEIVDSLQMDGRKVFHTRMYIDSNPKLFFVNMHSVFDSYINEDFYPHLFVADEKIDGVTYETEYRFNYSDSLIEITMTDIEDTTNIIQKEMVLEEKIQDGMSLIFFARGNITSSQTKNLTAFFNAEKGRVVLRIKGLDKKVKVNKLKNELLTVKIDGEAFLTSIAGFSGKYEGWFAFDEQAPPLQARMKVFIGYVNVELESWKHWNPPFQ